MNNIVLYGVHTEWFASYFRDHHQQVRLNTPNSPQLSEKRPNPIGVYQSTALGPLMFSIFVNDVSLFTDSDVLITQYAADTQVLVTGRKAELDMLVNRMENAQRDLFAWFSQNLMKINAGKTKLVIGTRQIFRGLSPVTLHVEGERIAESETA